MGREQRKENRAEAKLDKARMKKTQALAVERKTEMPKAQFATNDGKVVVHIHMPGSGKAGTMSQHSVPAVPQRETPSVKAAEQKVEKEQEKVEEAIKKMSSASSDKEVEAAKKTLDKAKKKEAKAREAEEQAKEGQGLV